MVSALVCEAGAQRLFELHMPASEVHPGGFSQADLDMWGVEFGQQTGIHGPGGGLLIYAGTEHMVRFLDEHRDCAGDPVPAPSRLGHVPEETVVTGLRAILYPQPVTGQSLALDQNSVAAIRARVALLCNRSEENFPVQALDGGRLLEIEGLVSAEELRAIGQDLVAGDERYVRVEPLVPMATVNRWGRQAYRVETPAGAPPISEGDYGEGEDELLCI